MAHPEHERGSVLLLFPAAVLVVLVLAAIAVDSAIVFLGERELANATAAAANDVSTEAFGDAAFYRQGKVELDEDTAQRLAEEHVRTALPSGRYHDLVIETRVDGEQVTVTASAMVDHLFGRVLPSGSRAVRVDATSRASAVERYASR